MYKMSLVNCSVVPDESSLVLIQDLLQMFVSLVVRVLEDLVALEFILDRYLHAQLILHV